MMKKELLTLLLLAGVGLAALAQPVLETGAGKKPMSVNEWIDKDTGHKVVRLVSRPGGNSSFYFNNECFVPQKGTEGDIMVFTGGTTKGKQLFTINLKTKAVTQLTFRSKVSGEMVCPKTREAFYQCGDSIFAANVDTRKERFIYAFDPSFKGRVGTVNADGTYMACVKAVGDQEREILKQYPEKRDFFQRIYNAHIEHVLYILDTRTKQLKEVNRENEWTNHLLFSPTDPNVLSYCHEGPWEKVDRIWNYNIATNRSILLHKRTMPMEIAGHEFFSPRGNTEWFDLQKPKGQTFFLAGYDMATGKEKIYQMDRNEWSIHFNVTADEKLFCGDGGDPNQVAKAPDGMWIYLFHPNGDRFRSEKLVNMKNHYYKFEPNVHFSPDEKWVIFRANFEGHEEIYAVEIDKATQAG
ncbi:oligogalacturonate lyase family protein [Mucilaginibacter daejeonensis]|uniref:oligogalacturonate lyase family protein n=1 Tax=Mucilaginibacter daejeonensis TaxID=398049 RepID=UPI001D170EA3|nr:oligogalacturonate lyase family protein [Mucilaginibacter daejeonensis]UEG53850.1 oligogalacturonate lyase family protein [Mucilaginibacter daejeonensis]